jgi:hypothetical protein
MTYNHQSSTEGDRIRNISDLKTQIFEEIQQIPDNKRNSRSI